MAEIAIEGVSKRYGEIVALQDVNLTVEDREFMVLLGPSGCGKTTLLRLIAGFETPDQGAIFIGGRDVTGQPPARRDLGMVFQSYALFPHMKVFDNIAFGLRMRRVPGAEAARRVRQTAELMRIETQLDRYPSQLSGGQRQRVALARALVTEPAVILMDEPLSNLDAVLRQQMRAELKRLLWEVRTTTVYVTHDQIEALSMGDRTAVMRDGEVRQLDTPLAVYERPRDAFVAGFVGSPPMNVLRAAWDGRGIELGGRRLALPPPDGVRPGQAILVGIRAENVRPHLEPGPGRLEAALAVVEPQGSHSLLTVRLGEQLLKVSAANDLPAGPGRPLWLEIDASNLRFLGTSEPEAD